MKDFTHKPHSTWDAAMQAQSGLQRRAQAMQDEARGARKYDGNAAVLPLTDPVNAEWAALDLGRESWS